MEENYRDENQEYNEVNPWLTIWYAPRTAIRSVIEFNTPTFAMILAIIVGITSVFDKAISDNWGHTMALPAILLFSVVGGGIGGLIGWWILSGVMTLVGKWFGGKATYKEMKMAVGAAYIPTALTIVFYFFDLLFLGKSLFMDVEITVFQTLWILLSAFISLILSVWTLFLVIKAIAEAHRFSAWKGLVTFLIPTIALVLILIFIAIIAFFI